MKLLLTCLILASSASGFQNPILPGFYPDPSICRVGDTYYLVNSTFEYFPGLPIHRSKDLANWELIGNALTRESQLPLKGVPSNGGLYAPTIRHWKGKFYLTCNNVGGGGNFIVTADKAEGPWSEPMWMDDFGIDGDLFFDDDGKAYYTRQDGGERGGLAQAEFDPATGRVLTPFKKIYNDVSEPWNEGPHLYKIKGWYYLLMAKGGTGLQHMAAIARSKSPSGPWEDSPHGPVLTNRDDPKNPIQCAGHADMVQAKDGHWWLVHLGTRPQAGGNSVLGRETFLAPLSWTADGWPIAWGDHHAQMGLPGADWKKPKPAAKPRRWSFKKGPLGPEWISVRHRDDKQAGIQDRVLRLGPTKDNLDEHGVPHFVGVRQSAFNMAARASLARLPEEAEAGLAVRYNEDHHYEVAWRGGKVRVQAKAKGQGAVLAEAPVEKGRLRFQITSSPAQYQFSYAVDGGAWTTLAAAAAAPLAPENGSGFTGAVIGVYAVGKGADFDWFETEEGAAPADIALSAVPTPTPLEPRERWLIRCGGGPHWDSRGLGWEADLGYVDGQPTGTTRTVEGTADSPLYQRERYGKDFSYRLPLKPGRYQLTLKFAEIYWHEKGERLMSVAVNGRRWLDRFDILAEAGGRDKAVDRSLKVEPDKDGYLNLRFTADFENAKVSAIEVVRLPEVP